MSRSRIAFAARRENTSIPVRPTTRTAGDSSLAGRMPRLFAGLVMSGQSKTPFSPYAIRASPDGPGTLRRSPSSNERAGVRQEGYRADVEVRGAVRRGEAIPRLVARKYRGRSKVQIQAYLCAIVQNLKRLLFPLYCWLLARRWSYSTNNPPHCLSNQSRPTNNC